MTDSFGRKVGKIVIILLDIVLVHAGFLIAFFVRFRGNLPLINFEAYLEIVPWLSLATVVIFYLFDFYSNWTRKSFYRYIHTITIAVVVLLLFTMAISFWYREFAFPRSVILMGGVLQVALIAGFRLIILSVNRRLKGKRKVLIIGKKVEDGLLAVEKFVQHAGGWFEVKNFITIEDKQGLEEILPQIDVILAGQSLSESERAAVMDYSFRYGKEVLIVPGLYELFVAGAEVQQIDDMLALSVVFPQLTALQVFMKRSFDILTAVVLLVITAPVMLLLGILIPLTSPGPALYKQERLGYKERAYFLYKFRSMINNAEEKTSPVLANAVDSRITSLGRFMRATRLDELPQLFNVLKGDMSLVGPRPERKFFVDRFKEEVPGYVYRMSVKPGITGLAQVMAKYDTTAEDKLRYDLMYICNYSLLLDLKIIFQTVLVVLQRKQAVGVKEESQEHEEMLCHMLQVSRSEISASREQG